MEYSDKHSAIVDEIVRMELMKSYQSARVFPKVNEYSPIAEKKLKDMLGENAPRDSPGTLRENLKNRLEDCKVESGSIVTRSEVYKGLEAFYKVLYERIKSKILSPRSKGSLEEFSGESSGANSPLREQMLPKSCKANMGKFMFPDSPGPRLVRVKSKKTQDFEQIESSVRPPRRQEAGFTHPTEDFEQVESSVRPPRKQKASRPNEFVFSTEDFEQVESVIPQQRKPNEFVRSAVVQLDILPNSKKPTSEEIIKEFQLSIESAADFQTLENLAELIKKSTTQEVQTALLRQILEKYRKMQETSLSEFVDKKRGEVRDKIESEITRYQRSSSLRRLGSLRGIRVIKRSGSTKDKIGSPKGKRIPEPKDRGDIDNNLSYSTINAILAIRKLIEMAAENRVLREKKERRSNPSSGSKAKKSSRVPRSSKKI